MPRGPSCAHGTSPAACLACEVARSSARSSPSACAAIPLTRRSYTLQCGKSRATPAPRRHTSKATPATNHSKPTRKRRATTKAVKQSKASSDEKQTSKVRFHLHCRCTASMTRTQRQQIWAKESERSMCVVHPDAWIRVDRAGTRVSAKAGQDSC